MVKLDKDKVQVRYITGINKCLPGYPTPLDVLYESCVESADGNLFSEAKMENKYGLDEDSVSKIIESLVGLEYIKKNNIEEVLFLYNINNINNDTGIYRIK